MSSQLTVGYTLGRFVPAGEAVGSARTFVTANPPAIPLNSPSTPVRRPILTRAVGVQWTFATNRGSAAASLAAAPSVAFAAVDFTGPG
jgi:hypothetical protein